MLNVIEKASAVVDKLMASHRALSGKFEDLTRERSRIALAAHADEDEKAQARLAKLNKERAEVSTEVENVAVALHAASKQLAEAQAAALAADQENAERERAAKIAAIFDKAEKIAEEIETSLKNAADLGHQLDDLVLHQARGLGVKAASRWHNARVESVLLALKRNPWKLERPTKTTIRLSELVRQIGGRS